MRRSLALLCMVMTLAGLVAAASSDGQGSETLPPDLAVVGLSIKHLPEIRVVNTELFGVRKLEVVYPQVERLADKGAEERINRFLADHVIRYEVAMDCARLEQENPEMPGDDDFTPSGRRCGEASDYSIRYNADGLLTLVVRRSQYGGGPYPGTAEKYHTLDWISGEALRVRDLIKEKDLPRFAKLVGRELARCLGNASTVTVCGWGADSGIALDRRGIRMDLDCGLVHAFQACEQADIPYSRIRPLIDPDRPAGRLINRGLPHRRPTR